MVLTVSIAVSLFLSLAALGMWLLHGSERGLEWRIRALAAARQEGGGVGDLPFQQRVVAPFVETLGRSVAALMPAGFIRRTERRLMLAGRPMGVPAFYTLMLGSGALLAFTYVLLAIAASGGTPSAVALLPAALLMPAGMYVVSFWLSAQAKGRKAEMALGLPDSLDLLTICVEAGLGLDAAFHRVAEKQSGPLVDEIKVMLREIGFGKPRRQALLDFADRTDSEDVRSFANAVIQAEQLGTSLAQILRAQSHRQRVRRRQRAEQEARRVPVKMVFPLVLCLMPALFIFILGPIIVHVMRFLSEA
jgi:tight adherence protein C